MDEDHGYPDGRVPLRELGDPDPGVRARRDSIRKIRRMSNWTAAALMVGTGAAAVALAHQSFPAAAPATAPAAGQGGGAATSAGRIGASPQATGGPTVTHSVATTTASGVTVTTTTRTVNGKTVVTQVRHGPAHRDD
jgi:hypothetical protein